jgi:hypothetical protein
LIYLNECRLQYFKVIFSTYYFGDAIRQEHPAGLKGIAATAAQSRLTTHDGLTDYQLESFAWRHPLPRL